MVAQATAESIQQAVPQTIEEYRREVEVTHGFLREMHSQAVKEELAGQEIQTVMKPYREQARALSVDLRKQATSLQKKIAEKEKPAFEAISAETKSRLSALRKQKREAGSTFDSLLNTLYDRAGVQRGA